MSQGGQFKPKYEVIDLKGQNFELIIDKELQSQIADLHSKHEGVEWCGMLFYDIEEGDFKDISKMKVRAKRLYLIDVGSAGYTEGELDEKLLDFYDAYPETMNMRMGFLHTHHSMGAFFSGTDMQELHDNTDKYNFYLSLIVNHKSKYCAKIATIGTTKFTIPGDDPDNPIESENSHKVMLTYNADIRFDVSDYFEERYEEVRSVVKTSTGPYGRVMTSRHTQPTHNTQGTLGFQRKDTSQASPGVSIEDGQGMDLHMYPADDILEMFDITDSYLERQSVLKKVYNLNIKHNDHRMLSKIISARDTEFKKANETEKKAMLEQIPNILLQAIIKEYKLATYDKAVMETIISAIGEQLVSTVDTFVPDFNANAFDKMIKDSVDALAYMSQLEEV